MIEGARKAVLNLTEKKSIVIHNKLNHVPTTHANSFCVLTTNINNRAIAKKRNQHHVQVEAPFLAEFITCDEKITFVPHAL